jgi:diguanylate cyclase (GGDEF)-like protein
MSRTEPPNDGRKSTVAQDEKQRLADGEQMFADSDQALSDADRTSSVSDQTSADSDQVAADRDQAASDRDFAAGGSLGAHEFSREMRERTSRERDQTAQARLDAAEQRDAIANARDVAALARDHAADARSAAMAQQDAHPRRRRPRALRLVVAPSERTRRAQLRAQAAEQRALAAQDREAAAQDRERAANERTLALLDREALARQLAIAETDALTGARARAAGLADLDHELDRCRRTGSLLVVAYVDVVGLETVNDTQGHPAGDELLKHIVALIKEHVRTYDLIIRLGGDELLCAMSDMTLLDARQRFSAIAAALAAAPGAAVIRTGFAELSPDEPATDLIARADSDLVDSRHDHRDSRP